MKDYKVDKASLSASFCQEVYQVVREIPVGKVSTYGGIAALLGMPQCSRMVGRALKQIPDDLSAPCHRVVNASGRLVPGWIERTDAPPAQPNERRATTKGGHCARDCGKATHHFGGRTHRQPRYEIRRGGHGYLTWIA